VFVQSGDRASNDDTWLRPVTNTNHLRDGAKRVHHGEFKKWLGPPDDNNRPWKLELSGRLLSLVTSISADAYHKVAIQQANLLGQHKPIPSGLSYCGLLHSEVRNLRSLPDLDCDVIFEPTEEPILDPAHANIVIYDKGPEQIMTVMASLVTALQLLPAAEVGSHPILGKRA
jgi:hypothetical protein